VFGQTHLPQVLRQRTFCYVANDTTLEVPLHRGYLPRLRFFRVALRKWTILPATSPVQG